MSYLHEQHDHVNMVTAMRLYAGSAPPPGDGTPPPPLIPQTDAVPALF